MMIDFLAEAAALRDELIARRRDFHRHPELAFEETRTAGIVAQELAKLGLEVQTGVGKTGVIGLLEGELDGPTVLVRADMDALPIQEENTFEHASAQPGVMHACGHDGHTTIALGVAKLLSQHRDRMAGRVKFVFQPAEEIVGGAKAMIADGALRDPRPDVSVGLHLWNGMPFGRLGVADGPVMAGSSTFTLRITGKGGHAASPHQAVDPVVCAAQIIIAFQTIVSRNANPLDSAVISVTQLDAGTAFNIIPQGVEMRGTIRAFRLEVRDLIERRMGEISRGIGEAMGCATDLIIEHHVLPVVNHPEVSARLRAVFGRMLGADALELDERTMGAEDVGLFMTDIPGMYFFLGAAVPDQEIYYGHHHPRFDFCEDGLPLGAALLAAAVAEYVLPGA
ncbi:MAG: amidohydrolase [Chloroflexi bacterium]|nr:amidohydrolase [Chloroflexota bacterium]MDL1885219.1 amidohydrolase [Anaerolineae bacterium CFX8]GIL14221.1 MAG: peptidase M20 [Chloroflexota bacterium]